MSADPAVAFRHIDVVFGDRPAAALGLLDQGRDRAAIQERTGHVVAVIDATLDVRQGEICVLMGLSGSGKSTLLRCANGLTRPARGGVLVNTEGRIVDVAACDARALKRVRTHAIAMVFQQFALLPWRSVAENVGFGLELQGVARRRRDAVVAEMLDLVGLEAWRDAAVDELSGGMQQRVGLARAFAIDAPILLMDEPFSALDPLIRSKLQDELLALQRRLGKTIVFVSHDLDEAMKLGSRIAIMEGGRIVQTGTPEEIALRPADAYVAEFVAHMNPVNVLTGGSIMTPVEALAAGVDGLPAEEESGATVRVDAAGRPTAAVLHGPGVGAATVPIVDDPGPDRRDTLPPRAVVAVTPAISLRDALEIRRRTGAPLVVLADGRLVGVIGNRELCQGVLGRAGAGGR